jgi:PPOX class probable F420-dependent enzyme
MSASTPQRTVPPDLLDLFAEPVLGHVSYLSDHGQIVTFPLWVDFDGERILTSSPVGSKKGIAFRARPGVAVSMVSSANQWHWLSVSGHVAEIRPDEDLAFIDRMSQKYTGAAYRRRSPREVFVIEIDRVSHSGARR